MKEYELVSQFVDVVNQLKVEGYLIKSENGFLIFNCNEEIVAEVQTVDGLSGFLRGVQMRCGK